MLGQLVFERCAISSLNWKNEQADYIIDGVESDLGDFDVDVLNQYDIENESIELSQVFANDKYTMFKINNKKM